MKLYVTPFSTTAILAGKSLFQWRCCYIKGKKSHGAALVPLGSLIRLEWWLHLYLEENYCQHGCCEKLY